MLPPAKLQVALSEDKQTQPAFGWQPNVTNTLGCRCFEAMRAHTHTHTHTGTLEESCRNGRVLTESHETSGGSGPGTSPWGGIRRRILV